MDVVLYKDIIVADNFITDEENNVLVSLIDKRICYNTENYWQYLQSDERTFPLKLLKSGDGIYRQSTVFSDITVNNVFAEIRNKILRIINVPGLKVENSGIIRYSGPNTYQVDNMVPEKEHILGLPSEIVDNYDDYNEYTGKWVQDPIYWNRFYHCHIFINNDFTGGNFTFPQHKIDITPTRNTLLCFPGNQHYAHGIRPINGSAFALKLWLSKS